MGKGRISSRDSQRMTVGGRRLSTRAVRGSRRLAAVYSGQGGIVYCGVLEQSNPQFGRCEMARGGRPKREAKKSKKTTPSAVNFSSVMVATPAVEVIKKKRKAKEDDF